MIIGKNTQTNSTLHRRVKKKKHNSLRQIFILSRDALQDVRMLNISEIEAPLIVAKTCGCRAKNRRTVTY